MGTGEFRTNYLGHDAEYRRRRAMGRGGWFDGDSLRLTLGRMERFLEDAGLGAGASVLELGCGAGDICLHFAGKGYAVAGVDISPYAIAWAKEKADALGLAAEFVIGDLTHELQLPLAPMDLVLDGHCLHCIIGKDRQVFLRNARNCLRPGGILHINSMCGDPHHGPSRPDFDPVSRCVVKDGVALRYFGRSEEIAAEVAAAGFRVEKFRVIAAVDENDEDCVMINARR